MSGHCGAPAIFNLVPVPSSYNSSHQQRELQNYVLLAGLGWAGLGWAGSSLTASLDLVAAAAAGLGMKTYFLLLVNHSPGQARLQAALAPNVYITFSRVEPGPYTQFIRF